MRTDPGISADGVLPLVEPLADGEVRGDWRLLAIWPAARDAAISGSTGIEGNPLDPAAVEKVLAGAAVEADADHIREVENLNRALNLARDAAARPDFDWSHEVIHLINATVVAGLPRDTHGDDRWPGEDVFVGIFAGPSPLTVQSLMDELVEWLRRTRGLLILRIPLYNPGRPIREPGRRTHERAMNITSPETDASLELATELADLFRTATRRLQRKTRDTLRPLGLSGSQARVVQLLADGPLRMSVIALRLSVVPRSATDVVDGCERAGVVVRRPDPEDRRSTLVALTPMGHHLLDQLAEARRESAARVFGPLTEHQRRELLTLLREIIEAEGNRR